MKITNPNSDYYYIQSGSQLVQIMKPEMQQSFLSALISRIQLLWLVHFCGNAIIDPSAALKNKEIEQIQIDRSPSSENPEIYKKNKKFLNDIDDLGANKNDLKELGFSKKNLKQREITTKEFNQVILKMIDNRYGADTLKSDERKKIENGKVKLTAKHIDILRRRVISEEKENIPHPIPSSLQSKQTEKERLFKEKRSALETFQKNFDQFFKTQFDDKTLNWVKTHYGDAKQFIHDLRNKNPHENEKDYQRYLQERLREFTLNMIFIAAYKDHCISPYSQMLSKADHLKNGSCFGDSAVAHEMMIESDYRTYFKTLKEETESCNASKGKFIQNLYENEGKGFVKPRGPHVSTKDQVEYIKRRDKTALEHSKKLTYQSTDIYQKKTFEKSFGEFFIEKLDSSQKKIAEHGGAVFVTMQGNGEGHAINLKIDDEKGVYIIRDVNYGKCILFVDPDKSSGLEKKFSNDVSGNYNDFKECLKDLLNTTYPGFDTVTFSYATKNF